MPSLKFGKRTWNIASDDFVHSSIWNSLLKLGIILLLLYPEIFLSTHSPACYNYLLTPIILYSITLMSAMEFVLFVILGFLSSRGGIMESEKRSNVPKLAALIFFMNLIDMILLAIGFYSIYYEFKGPRLDCKNSSVPLWTSLSGLIVMANQIIFILVLFFFSFNALGKFWYVFYQRSEDFDDFKNTITDFWFERMKSVIFPSTKRTEVSTTEKQALLNSAQIFANLLSDSDLVLSDFLAGIFLLKYQSRVWLNSGRFVPKEAIENTTQPWIKFSIDNDTRVNYPVKELSHTSYDMTDDWLNIQKMRKISRLASAVYGWKVHAITRPTRCLCCLPRRINTKHDKEYKSNLPPNGDNNFEPDITLCICKQRNANLAVLLDYCRLPIDDVVYISTESEIFTSPFFIAVLRDIDTFVISIRGTLSVSDAIVDTVADGESFHSDEVPHDAPDISQCYAHKGILQSTRRLYQTLMNQSLIEHAMNRVGNKKHFIVTGHSLGAGIATLLTLMLKRHYPGVKCYAYAPPLGLMSEELGAYCSTFIVSIVYGFDIVSRMSMETLEDMKYRLIHALTICKLPKYKIISNAATISLMKSCCPCLSGSKSLIGEQLDSLTKQRLCNTTMTTDDDAVINNANDYLQLDDSNDDIRLINNKHRSLVYYLKRNYGKYRTRMSRSGFEKIPMENNSASVTLSPTTFSHLVLHLVEVDKRFHENKKWMVKTEDGISFQRVEHAQKSCGYCCFGDCSRVRAESNLDDLQNPTNFSNSNKKESRRASTGQVEKGFISGKCCCYCCNPSPVAIWSHASQFKSIIVHSKMLTDHQPNYYDYAFDRLGIRLNPYSKGYFHPLDTSCDNKYEGCDYVRQLNYISPNAYK